MSAMTVAVRLAELGDMWDVYRIAMDPTTRAMSTRSEAFSEDQHRQWYQRRIVDADQLFLIATVRGTVVGYVRYGRTTAKELTAARSPRAPKAHSVEVSIAIAPRHRSQGYAIPALEAAEAELRRRWPECREILALVLTKNEISKHVFERGGYQVCGEETRFGKRHIIFSRVLPVTKPETKP